MPSSAASIDWPMPRGDIATFGAACAISNVDSSPGETRHAPLHRHACHRDQHLLAAADRASPPTRRACSSGPASIPTMRRACAPRRCSSPAGAPPSGRLHADRGQLLCRQPGRHDQPRRLRDHARRDPGPAQGGAAGRRRAARPARRHGGHGYDDVEGDIIERVRAIVGAEVRDRRRARSALPSDAEARAARRHHRALQGVPAHRRGRARRGRARPRAGDPARQDQAGDVGLRLPPDPELSDHAAADARPSSTASRRWRARTASCRSRSCHCFPYGDVPEIGTPRAGDRRRRQGEGRCAGDQARRGAGVHARQDHAASSSTSTGGVAAALAFNDAAGRDRRARPTMPAAARRPTTPTSCAS